MEKTTKALQTQRMLESMFRLMLAHDGHSPEPEVVILPADEEERQENGCNWRVAEKSKEGTEARRKAIEDCYAAQSSKYDAQDWR